MLSIRTKLILLLSLILLSGFFATSYFSYTASRDSLHNTIVQSNLPLSRDNIYSEIQKDLARPIFVSSLMANDTFLKDWVIGGETSPYKIKNYLNEIQNKYGFSSAFFVSDLSNNYYHFNGILKQVSQTDSHDVWYYRFKSGGKRYELDVDTNEAAQNTLTIFINHRLESYEGTFLGVVGVGLDLNRMSSLLDEYRQRYQRTVYMTDANGLIQVHRDKAKIESQSIFEIPGLVDHAPQILDKYNTAQIFEYDDDDRHIILTSRYIKEMDWFLMVEQDETLVLEGVRHRFLQNILISVFITLVTLVFATLAINHFQKKLETLAMEDPLTRAYNRNEFERRFKFMTDQNRRTPLSMAMILLDIDNLKAINDTQGHLAGDRVIKTIAGVADRAIRGQDMLVRWGGDEFIILVLSGLDQALQVAERIRSGVEQCDFQDNAFSSGPDTTVSISCGVAAYETGQTLDHLLNRADQALYQAKAKGKNTIVTAGASSDNTA